MSFRTSAGRVNAVNGLNLTVRRRERVGIVGESGSGKSVTVQALLGLLDENAVVTGKAEFDGLDLLRATPKQMREIRGKGIGYIFQDPLSALDPVRTIGEQVTEALRIRGVGSREASRRSIDMLGRVGLKEPARRMEDYPHELSGGMRQRVMIAMALVAEPQLVIADEPTTALDVRIQAKVLDLLWELAEERELAVIFVTHDLGVLAGFAEGVTVMYSGRVMEQCSVDDMFAHSVHPYTLGLLDSVPRITGPVPDRLITIGGRPPAPQERIAGCPFHPRCRFRIDECATVLPEATIVGTHVSACHRAGWLNERTGSLA
ncbi:oligopeptide/dipeptide ABC transporter ATP-binding protein [Microbacterium ulmi]|uniref:ABC transporter ATP-binding protein n=1 Tax=Microbacterium ulmi TaxID=179095 RepID=A0A7Y2LYI4_9MICO|nr:oligopeptide/dipeptide ABC transporter ATP-binding protein [Microbacterium ulmi]NNH03195.1 ABC transporter ATP-binding protein [Microbacterium ulmi]